MPPNSLRPTGLLLSGGLDSCILLGHLVGRGDHVQPFYVRSQLAWEREELVAVDRFLAAVASPAVKTLVILDLPLRDLYGDHWGVTGEGVPDTFSADNEVYLPGRNALLVVKPAVWCQLHGIDQLALAVLKTNPFADATAGFFDPFESALDHALGRQVRIIRPFGQFDKRKVMELGRGRGMPLELTFSCISPIDGLHCGRCNKCAERQTAFRSIGADDPTEYAKNPVQTT